MLIQKIIQELQDIPEEKLASFTTSSTTFV